MKITPKQYAQSLFEALNGKQAPQVKAAIKNFITILAVNHDLAKADKIIASFIKIWNMENEIADANITTAKPLSSTMVKMLNKYVKNISQAKQVELSQSIDKNILGGVIIRYGDRVIDSSLKMQLSELKEKLIK